MLVGYGEDELPLSGPGRRRAGPSLPRPASTPKLAANLRQSLLVPLYCGIAEVREITFSAPILARSVVRASVIRRRSTPAAGPRKGWANAARRWSARAERHPAFPFGARPDNPCATRRSGQEPRRCQPRRPTGAGVGGSGLGEQPGPVCDTRAGRGEPFADRREAPPPTGSAGPVLFGALEDDLFQTEVTAPARVAGRRARLVQDGVCQPAACSYRGKAAGRHHLIQGYAAHRGPLGVGRVAAHLFGRHVRQGAGHDAAVARVRVSSSCAAGCGAWPAEIENLQTTVPAGCEGSRVSGPVGERRSRGRLRVLRELGRLGEPPRPATGAVASRVTHRTGRPHTSITSTIGAVEGRKSLDASRCWGG